MKPLIGAEMHVINVGVASFAAAVASAGAKATQVEFEVTHLMFAKVRGRFRPVAGALQIGAGPALGASSEATVTLAAAG